MQNEDKIFGLIAQAEDIQKHAIALQRAAQDAVKTLPDASRSAVRDAAREFIIEGVEKASRGLLDASNEAKATSAALRQTGLYQGVFLVAVAIVLAAGFIALTSYMSKSKLAELHELKATIRTEEGRLAELRSKTWELELMTYNDGGRGIILPKGTAYSHTAKQNDGRTVIIIKP